MKKCFSQHVNSVVNDSSADQFAGYVMSYTVFNVESLPAPGKIVRLAINTIIRK